MEISLIYTTFPTREDAIRVSQELLAERLVACSNIFSSIISLYIWNEKAEEAQEVAVLLKTSPKKVHILIERLHQLHPYDTPAILEIPATSGLPAFGKWIEEAVNDRG